MPSHNCFKSSFSLGACSRSSGRPMPVRMTGAPLLPSAGTTGIEPPARAGTVPRPTTSRNAWSSSLNAGCVTFTVAGSAPCRNLTLARTGLGANRRTAAASWRSTALSFWSGTRRRLTFAVASAGITVFAPSPVNPPVIPWISKVGRAQRRSSTEYALSPVSAFAWTRCFKNSPSRKGSRFQVASSTLEGRFTDAYRPGTRTLPSGVFKRPSRRASSSWALGAGPPGRAGCGAGVGRGAAREQLAVAHRRLERRRGPLVERLGRLHVVVTVDEEGRRARHLGPDAPHHRVRAAPEELYLATAETTQLAGDPLRGRAAVGVVRCARRDRWDPQKVGELAQQAVGVHGAKNLDG